MSDTTDFGDMLAYLNSEALVKRHYGNVEGERKLRLAYVTIRCQYRALEDAKALEQSLRYLLAHPPPQAVSLVSPVVQTLGTRKGFWCPPPTERNTVKITVCDACLTVACWQGLFYCPRYKTAGTNEMSFEKLLKLNLEHPSYSMGSRLREHDR